MPSEESINRAYQIFCDRVKPVEVVEELIDQGQLVKTDYQGNSFYLRRPNISIE